MRRTTAGRDVERLLRDGIDPPDARLLHRFLHDRDESAFETLVDRHGPLVLSLCKRYLRDPRDVEDAFQATFLVLVRKGAGLRDRDALASWLYGVARRTALRARSNVLTRRDREGGGSEALDEAPAESAPPFDDALETLDEELARLPEKYRAPLILCHLKGRTYDQAAAELGWPPGTVRSRTARARALLRGRLKRRGVDASAYLPLLRLEPAVPPLLVAATVAAVDRFPAFPNGPVAALAQGVIAAMSLSPSKLLKIALGSLAVTAAAGSIALGAYIAQGGISRQEPVQTVEIPTAKVEDKVADEDPSGRQAKVDRFEELLSRTSASRPLSPIAPTSLDELTTGVAGPGGLREIEAQLLNAYSPYKVALKMRRAIRVSGAPNEAANKAFAEDEERRIVEPTVTPVRALFARLLTLKDSRTDMEQAIKDRTELLEGLAQEVAKKDHEYEAVRERIAKDPAADRRRAESQLNRLADELDRGRGAIAAAKHDLTRLQLAIKPLDRRTADVDRLIKWTREHFKEVPLTIDDAPADAKSE